MRKTIIAAALVAIAVTGCYVDPKQEAARSGQVAALQDKLDQQRAKTGVFNCANASECDRAFKLAKIYVSSTAEMRVRLSDDVQINTYPSPQADRGVRLALGSVLMPNKGGTGTVELDAGCYALRAGSGPEAEACYGKMLRAFAEFKPFIESRL